MVRLAVGQGQYAFLMRIKNEYFEEDQKVKEQDILEMERGITGSPEEGDEDGQYGEVKLKQPKRGTLRKKNFKRSI